MIESNCLRIEEDIKLFIGPNADGFLDLWRAQRNHAAGNTRLYWVSFLAPMVWFLYRKMYLTAAVMTITALAVSFVFHSDTISKALGFAFSAIGGLGPRFYLRSAQSTIADIRVRALSEEEAHATIARAGGVSIASAVIGGLIMISAIVLSVVSIHIPKTN
jgi:hypothetical protein